MRNIILDNIVFSLQRGGGISIVWQELLKNILDKEEFNIKCLEYSESGFNIFRKELQIPDNKIIKSKKSIKLIRYLDPLLKIEAPTIFHSSYYRINKSPLIKNVTTVHDFTYELLSSGIRTAIHKWQKFRAINNSETIVCISQNTVKDLLKFIPNIEREKIRVIYNGVSEDYRLDSTYRKTKSNSVLFVGMRSNYKNFDFTVEALAGTKYNLIICGAPLTSREEKFLNEKLGEDRYEYAGRVTNKRLNQLYNSVHCLAYPSSYEGFGIPILEAQRAKCPIIALYSSSIPEVMGAKSFLLKDLNISEFRDRLKQLENENVRAGLEEEGFEFSQKFSWEKMASEYMDLYNELLRK